MTAFSWPALPASLATPELIRTLNVRLPRLAGTGAAAGGGGTVIGGASVGAAGADIFLGDDGAGTLRFRKLKAGANVTLTPLAGSELQIDASAGGGGALYFANILRSAVDSTGLDTVTQYLADTGHLASGMQASTAIAVNRLFAKALSTDANTVDTIAGLAGSTYGVTLLSALTSGQIDLSKTGVINRYGGYIARGAGDPTGLDTIVANLTNASNAGAGMKISDATTAINRLFAKALLTDPNTADAITSGLSYIVTTLNQATGGGRGFAALNTSNILTTGVDRAATIAGQYAQLIAKGAQGVVFSETFEELPSNWNSRGGSGTTSLVSGGGVTGGQALRCTGQVWLAFPYNIPYDPSKLYRMRARAKQVTDPTAGGKNFYFGVEGVAADGTTLINTSGANSASTQHYVCAQFTTLAAGGPWTEYTGWFKGTGTTNVGSVPSTDPAAPKQLYTGVTYFRPLLIANISGGNGVADIDYLAIDVFDEEGLDRTYTILDTGQKLKAAAKTSDAVTAINRLFAKTLSTDANTVDTVAGLTGSTYGITLLTALTSGQVDLAKAGVIGKLAANILRTGGGADLQAILANLTDVSNAGAAMKISDATTAINRLFAKALLADANNVDTLAALTGSTYGITLLSALTSGQVDLAKAGVVGKVAANLLRVGGGADLQTILANLTDTSNAGASMKISDATTAINRLFAKAVLTDANNVDTLAGLAGSTYGITLLSALTSGQVDLAKAGVIGRIAANILRAGGGTDLQTILANVTDASNAGAGMKISDATTLVNRLFAKTSIGDANTVDTIAALTGSSYGVTLLTALTGGAVDLTKSGVIGNLAANRITASSLSAITAALGTVTSGLIQNASASPTAAIRLTNAATLPTTAYNVIDLAATAGANVLRFGPSLTDARLTYTADGTLTITGVVRPSQLAQSSTGSGDFAGSDLFTGTAVFAEATGTRTTGKRVDLSGGRLRVLIDSVSRYEVGDRTTSAGATSTVYQDTTWPTTTSGNVVNSASSTWTASAGGSAGPENTIENIVATPLPATSDTYLLDYNATISQTWTGVALDDILVEASQVRLRLYTTKNNGGVWKDQGIIDSVAWGGITRGQTTTINRLAIPVTVAAADVDNTNSNTHFKIVPEVYCGSVTDNVGTPRTVTATGTCTVTGGTSKVAWSKTAGGTTFARRYPALLSIAGQPLGFWEPNTLANLPADNAGADGEFAYSSTDHAPYFWDGIRRGVLQPEIFKRLTAANAATTSTTGANVVGLDLAVQAGEVWEVEWIGDSLQSVTTATLGFNVAGTATFTARSSYHVFCSAGAPNTGAGIARYASAAAGIATGTAGGMGNPGSATLPVPWRVTAYLKINASGTVSLQIASSSGTVTVQEGSRMSAWRSA